MKWIMNEIQEEQLNSITDKLDGQLLFDRLAYNLGYSREELQQYIDVDNAKTLLATLLINRNMQDNVDVINRPQDYILDPLLLHNADKAANLIKKYCLNPNAVIYIYSDYDVDGVTSGYVAWSSLRRVSSADVKVYYPNREDGYGLNMQYCIDLVNSNESRNKDILLITVDNGITKKKEVAYLKEHGIEVVVTDHHPSKANETPDCIIVDPHNSDEEQDDTYKHLCGCGVAFKVVQLVQEKCGINEMYRYLPHLAIATVADVMPMATENLAFIQYGLDIINSNDCPRGIKVLKEQEGIDLVTVTSIAWTIAPMINACGRIAETEVASRLFNEDDLCIAKSVDLITKINEDRKKHTKRATKELSEMKNAEDKVFIFNTNSYPNGILGIIAGKATDIFNKPSIVVTTGENGIAHGSSRSINGINLIPIFKQLKEEEVIVDYGGHAEAAGVFFKAENEELLRARLNELIVIEEVDAEEQSLQTEEDILQIDQILTLDNINIVMLALSNILPADNREIKNAVYAVCDCEVIAMQRSKANPDNVKLSLKQGKKRLDIWAWGLGNKYVDEMLCPKQVHVAGTITKCFLTKRYALKIMDITAA